MQTVPPGTRRFLVERQALPRYIQGPHPDLFIESLRFPPPSSRIVTYVTYFGAACALLLVRAAQIKHLGWGSGYDVGLYHSYARSWASGAAPYVGFAPEYPPGALCLFLLPYLFSDGGEDYSHAFAYEMGLLDLASCLLVVAWARRLRPQSAGFPIRAALGYLVVSTALFPVIYSRFDLAPAALSIAALYLLYGRYEGWGSALLGAAAAVKLWPLALAPLAAIRAYRRAGLLGAARVACFTGLGVAAVVGPFVPRAGRLVARFLEYHGARGIEVGSTWASLAFVLDLLHISPAKPEHNFGAFHVGGPAATVFVKISTVATLACILIPPASARGDRSAHAGGRGAGRRAHDRRVPVHGRRARDGRARPQGRGAVHRRAQPSARCSLHRTAPVDALVEKRETADASESTTGRAGSTVRSRKGGRFPVGQPRIRASGPPSNSGWPRNRFRAMI